VPEAYEAQHPFILVLDGNLLQSGY
jgi:hypothetical protein